MTAENRSPRLRNNSQQKKRRIPTILMVFGALCLLAGGGFLGFRLYQLHGKASFQDHAGGQGGPDTEALSEQLKEFKYSGEGRNTEDTLSPGELPEGQIAYRGKIYEYNEELLTFLILGIDNREGIGEGKDPGTAGQADMIMLLVIDETEKSLKVINVSRDIMVKVKTYATSGVYAGEEEMQIALQYAYGDGREKSCEMMEEAVSDLFYGIPIHGYGALEMQAIVPLNDGVGGVEVEVMEDLSRIIPSLKLGQTLTLMGEEAFYYVQYRNINSEELGANNLRIARQKQYLTGYFKKVKEKTKGDITFPLQLYGIAKEHMVTSITADQIAYLSTAVLGCTFTDEDLMSVQGTIERPGSYEEFRVEEEALYGLIIEVFYQEKQ